MLLKKIKKKKKQENVLFHLIFRQSYSCSLYHLYSQDVNLGINVTVAQARGNRLE